jgi:hypothetical protein
MLAYLSTPILKLPFWLWFILCLTVILMEK